MCVISALLHHMKYIEPETNGFFTKNGNSLFYLRNLTTLNKRTLSLQCVLYKVEGEISL